MNPYYPAFEIRCICASPTIRRELVPPVNLDAIRKRCEIVDLFSSSPDALLAGEPWG